MEDRGLQAEGLQLPVPGGYDSSGQITRDPGEIYKTKRVLVPMGFWKGSGISIALDMIASVLTAGNAVHTIGTFEDEIGLSQMMIAIDPSKVNTEEQTDAIVMVFSIILRHPSRSMKQGLFYIRVNRSGKRWRSIGKTGFLLLKKNGIWFLHVM